MIESGATTDRGRHRTRNEDAFLVMEDEQVFAVADGVGGSSDGRLASRTLVQTMEDFIRRREVAKIDDLTELARAMRQCLREANENILQLTREQPQYRGMATTAVICCIRGHEACIVNIGDSRLYLRRGSSLFQITEDHSYVNALVKSGVIRPEDAAGHQQGNIITRAVGATEDLRADYYSTDLEDGDVLLLCSDGLYRELKEEVISDCIRRVPRMQDLAAALVDRANEAGGRDNITAVCIRYRVEGEQQ
ncbi:MAG: Stp1/IreP family PP2C-type Ser/Thr phosphatase [Anaerovoracaceae bacterium]|jgi:serine/threonine protein phosphatase PrpC